MPTISFSFRSKKDISNLEIRLTYYNEENKRRSLYARTKNLEVSAEFWNDYRNNVNFRDIDKVNLKLEVDKHLHELRSYLQAEALKVDVFTKEWFKDVVKDYYNPEEPEEPENAIPTDLIGFIDYFIKTKKNEISDSKRKRLITTKNKMIRLEAEYGYKILIAEVNEKFKTDYINFSKTHQYSQNTQQRELARIKSICREAKYLGLVTHRQLDRLKIEREIVKHPYLSFDELETIKNHHFDKDYLNNARDWLIISCYTGQRISDFMRFNSDMIEQDEDGDLMINFTQIKTNKEMELTLLDEVIEILAKRDGSFPRPISEQKYNDYIKEVCKACELDEVMIGKKRMCIYPDKPISERTRYDYRDVTGKYPKHELITSHIGRRSFATNYYGKVDTHHLINITGHSTERMFLNYIQRGNKQISKEAGNAVREANRKLKNVNRK